MYWQIYQQIDLKRRLVSIKASRTKSFGSAIDNWDEVLLSLAAPYWDILGMSKWDFVNICAIYKSTLLQRLSHTGRWLESLSLRRWLVSRPFSLCWATRKVSLSSSSPYGGGLPTSSTLPSLFSYILLAFPIFLCPTFFFRVCRYFSLSLKTWDSVVQKRMKWLGPVRNDSPGLW